MRSSDEQFQEILKRASHLHALHAERKAVKTFALSSAACAALLIAAVCFLPVSRAGTQAVISTQYGSLLLDAPYVAYVIVAIPAFLLGVFVTLLVFHIRKTREKERGRS